MKISCREDAQRACSRMFHLREHPLSSWHIEYQKWYDRIRGSDSHYRIYIFGLYQTPYKHLKKNRASLWSYPVGLAFSPKHHRLFITDRLLHSVFMVDMHRPANVTLIAGGGEPRHTNGHANTQDEITWFRKWKWNGNILISYISSYLFFLDISVQGGKVHEVIPMWSTNGTTQRNNTKDSHNTGKLHALLFSNSVWVL